MLQHLLFPQLKGTWGEVNFDAIARQNNFDADAASSIDHHWVDLLHQRMGIDYSYGGYMEYRSFLLRNHYHKDLGTDHFWHLGIDYTVPVFSAVHMPVDGTLVDSGTNNDQDGGWGGRLIFQLADGSYLLLGHLDGFVNERRLYKKGEDVALVGPREVNGGWFPHLHVQRCRVFNPDVDGYSHMYEGIYLDYPDPEGLINGQASQS